RNDNVRRVGADCLDVRCARADPHYPGVAGRYAPRRPGVPALRASWPDCLGLDQRAERGAGGDYDHEHLDDDWHHDDHLPCRPAGYPQQRLRGRSCGWGYGLADLPAHNDAHAAADDLLCRDAGPDWYLPGV